MPDYHYPEFYVTCHSQFFDFTKLLSSLQTQVISFSGFVKFAIIAVVETLLSGLILLLSSNHKVYRLYWFGLIYRVVIQNPL